MMQSGFRIAGAYELVPVADAFSEPRVSLQAFLRTEQQYWERHHCV